MFADLKNPFKYFLPPIGSLEELVSTGNDFWTKLDSRCKAKRNLVILSSCFLLAMGNGNYV